MPAAVNAGENISVRDVFDAGDLVAVRVISVDNTQDFVLSSAKPAFLEIMEDAFYAGLGTGDIACVSDCDR